MFLEFHLLEKVVSQSLMNFMEIYVNIFSFLAFTIISFASENPIKTNINVQHFVISVFI